MDCPRCKKPLPADATFCPDCGIRPAAPPQRSALDNLATIAPMRDTARALEPGTLFAGRYEVIREIGRGGMGVVYLARDTNTSEEMVLKLIHPDLVNGEEAVKRLMTEGLTARQIRHPNIVAVYDVALWEGQPYFTMEFVKGGALRSWMMKAIHGGSETSLDTAAGLIRSMLAGLGEAHRLGIVHRDLKPENVLLCGDPAAGDYSLKILDFGIAKAVSAPSTRGTGGAVGTPFYMAPEQMTSAEAVGPAADLYSLTVIFYELLMEALPQGRWEPVGKSRPEIPKSVDELIEKGLSARPRSRFASVAEYSSALDTAVVGTRPVPQPPPVPPVPPVEPPVTPGGGGGGLSLPVKIGLGIAAALVVVLGLSALGVLGLVGVLSQDKPRQVVDEPEIPPDKKPEEKAEEKKTPPDEPKVADDEPRRVKPKPPPPPPPPTNVAPFAGYWVDAGGTGANFTVLFDGRNFRADGNGFTIQGEIVNGQVAFVSTNSLGQQARGAGRVYTSNAGGLHLQYSMGDGITRDFAINHRH